MREVIDDLFEHITLYDNRASDVSYTRISDDEFRVVIEVEAKKFRADEVGNENEVPMNDLVDIGIFAAVEPGKSGEGKPLYVEKHRIASGAQRIEVMVDEEPARAGVDPYHKLIDRVTRDNTVTATRLEAPAG
jgi:hypothetical protein